ncbi:hypothetical protein IMCC1989_1499 [gamma proteobacterium IMCC1989]|nr:hypothetical protein IMCC1989_1499 [gamma proteobacterium IMCC1989]
MVNSLTTTAFENFCALLPLQSDCRTLAPEAVESDSMATHLFECDTCKVSPTQLNI